MAFFYCAIAGLLNGAELRTNSPYPPGSIIMVRARTNSVALRPAEAAGPSVPPASKTANSRLGRVHELDAVKLEIEQVNLQIRPASFD